VLGLPPLPNKYKGVAVAAVLLLVMVAVSGIYGRRGLVHLRELEKKQNELGRLALELQRENEERHAHLRRLADDDSYIEKLVRERLGWIKPGETVYRVRGVNKLPAVDKDGE
jgi:cell division protein FtsB